MVNFSLEGKVAWVTGASYGIGFALATAFSEAGICLHIYIPPTLFNSTFSTA